LTKTRAFVYKKLDLQNFSETGWNAKGENSCVALLTPPSAIFEGVRADVLPVAPMQLEWCAIHADAQSAW
jgi:hypothetical protein